jgi:hypothetical protein
VPADRVLVLACGALSRELREIVDLNHLEHVDVQCLPARLHNTPADIPAAVEARLADVAERHGATRLPGAHCYEFYAGSRRFAELFDDEPGSFYLTDYLVRFFDRIVIQGLGLDRHPELRDDYFGNYRRLVHLAQSDDPDLTERARAAAERLGLEYHHEPTTYGELGTSVVEIASR